MRIASPAARLVLALLAGALAPTARAADPARGKPAESGSPRTWYAQALTRGDAGLSVTHFWSKDSMLRAETVVSGHKIVTIVRGEWYYAFDGLLGQGVAIRREPAAVGRDAGRIRPFGNEYEILLGQGAEQIRTEQLLGREAGVFRITDQHGRRELWVTLDADRIPLRLEIFDRPTGQKRYTDYVNWVSGLPIPDGFFEAGPGIEFERLDFAEYLKRRAEEGPLGPAPVLYTYLLHVRAED